MPQRYGSVEKKRKENSGKIKGQQSQNRILVGNEFQQYEESCQDHFIKIFLSHIIRAAPTPNQLWRITIKTFPRKQWLPVVIQSRLPDSVKNFNIYSIYGTQQLIQLFIILKIIERMIDKKDRLRFPDN